MQTDYTEFPHHRLDAWRVALEMAQLAKMVADDIPRGYRSFADQLLRSSGSVVLLIGEGANRHSAGQKRQRYGEARGECGEVAATAELLAVLGLAQTSATLELRQLSGRVAAMLTQLIRRFS